MNTQKFEIIARRWLSNLPESSVANALSLAEEKITELRNFEGSTRADARKHFLEIASTAEKLSGLLARPPFAQVVAGDLADYCGAPINDLKDFFEYLQHIDLLTNIAKLRARLSPEGGGRHRWEDEAGMPSPKLFAAVMACLIWRVAFGTLPDDETIPFGDFVDELWTACGGEGVRESWPRKIQDARNAISDGDKVDLLRRRPLVPAPGWSNHPLDGLERNGLANVNAYDWATQFLGISGLKSVAAPI